jgi:hypothetical protein
VQPPSRGPVPPFERSSIAQRRGWGALNGDTGSVGSNRDGSYEAARGFLKEGEMIQRLNRVFGVMSSVALVALLTACGSSSDTEEPSNNTEQGGAPSVDDEPLTCPARATECPAGCTAIVVRPIETEGETKCLGTEATVGCYVPPADPPTDNVACAVDAEETFLFLGDAVSSEKLQQSFGYESCGADHSAWTDLAACEE